MAESHCKEILCYLERKYDTPEKKQVFALQLDAFLQQFKTPQPQQPLAAEQTKPMM